MSRSDTGPTPNIGVLPQEGDIRRVEIVALAAGGRGVARAEGIVWFVVGAVPGDVVEAQVFRARGSFVEARMLRLDRASPGRREPPCPVQAQCGGCPWMVLDDHAQRRWKQRVLTDALSRIGGLQAPPVEPVRVPGPSLAYRNRVEFTVALGAGEEPAIGFHSTGPLPSPVDVERCLLQHDSANAVLKTVRRFLLDPRKRLAESLKCGGSYRLLLRRSLSSREIVVGLGDEGRPFPHARRLAEHLRRTHPELVGVVRYATGRAGRTGLVRIIVGRGWIRERVAGTDFRVPATTFTQVSEPGADELASIVLELAGEVEGMQVFDLYGGIGVYGFALARRGARRITVCDVDGAAIRCGKLAARYNDSVPIEFVRADTRLWLLGSAQAKPRVDLVVANPPRSGLGAGVGAAIRERAPRRVVLVSCDPATLARDLRGFVGSNYTLSRVVPVDLFPQTAHVETVARLDRR